jgi:hypothetical protein
MVVKFIWIKRHFLWIYWNNLEWKIVFQLWCHMFLVWIWKDSTANNSSNFPFLSCIGSLLYLVQGIGFDLCWIVCYLARFSSCFDYTHFQAVKHVLRYLKRTSDFKMKISTQHCLKLNGFVYSDFAGCEDTRRSTYWFGIFLGNDLYFWKSKLQNSVVYCIIWMYPWFLLLFWRFHWQDIPAQVHLPQQIHLSSHYLSSPNTLFNLLDITRE